MDEKKEQDCDLAPINDVLTDIEYNRIESKSQQIEQAIDDDSELQFLLALTLNDKSAYESIKELITEDFFYKKENRYLYLDIKNQFEVHGVNNLSLIELSKNNTFEKLKFKCDAYYKALMSGLLSAINYRALEELNIAITNLLTREIQILSQAISKTSSLSKIITLTNKVNVIVQNIEERSKGAVKKANDYISINDLFDTAIKQDSMFTTNINSIDNGVIGVNRGTITTIVAKPNHGKTALAMQIAKNQCIANKDMIHIYFAKEQPGKEINIRYLHHYSGVNMSQLILGNQYVNCYEKGSNRSVIIKAQTRDYCKTLLEKANLQIEADMNNLFVIDDGFNNMNDVKTIIEKIKQGNSGKKLGNVFIDHWHAFSFDGNNKTNFQENEASILLKMVKELDFHCFLLAQAKKKELVVKGKALRNIPLTSEDIKGSNAVKEISHQVWIIHNPTNEEQSDDQNDENNKSFLLLDKSRNTSPGERTPLFFNKGNCSFE
jgi:replicative DNA helicase